MGNLAALGNVALTAIVGVVLLYYLKDRFEQVDKRFEQVDKRFEQVDKRFDRVDERFLIVHEELRQLRGEVFQVAMALGVQQRPREV